MFSSKLLYLAGHVTRIATCVLDNGVSRKSVPTFVGTLFEFWGVCFIIDLCPPQFEPLDSISPHPTHVKRRPRPRLIER